MINALAAIAQSPLTITYRGVELTLHPLQLSHLGTFCNFCQFHPLAKASEYGFHLIEDEVLDYCIDHPVQLSDEMFCSLATTIEGTQELIYLSTRGSISRDELRKIITIESSYMLRRLILEMSGFGFDPLQKELMEKGIVEPSKTSVVEMFKELQEASMVPWDWQQFSSLSMGLLRAMSSGKRSLTPGQAKRLMELRAAKQH